MLLHPSLLTWLNEGDTWVRYRAARYVSPSSVFPPPEELHALVLADPFIQKLRDELHSWPGKVVVTHRNWQNPYHKLVFLADAGIHRYDHGMEELLEKIISFRSEEGPLHVLMNIPEHFGGTGKDTGAWALCDAPLLVYALAKMGYETDHLILQAASYLKNLIRDNGYPCAVSKELGSFRGPGKKSDPCPYATLVMLKMLQVLPGIDSSEERLISSHSLLQRWEHSLGEHPYAFYMGNDFRKLKMPMMWYDIIHVLEVLSHEEAIRDDMRLRDMASCVASKVTPDGLFIPESVYQYWSAYDVGQKKIPSRWLTLEIFLILERLQML